MNVTPASSILAACGTIDVSRPFTAPSLERGDGTGDCFHTASDDAPLLASALPLRPLASLASADWLRTLHS